MAGKRAPAQKVKEGEAGYAETVSSARSGHGCPRADPRLVILVMVDEPTTEHLGAVVAAPAFCQDADLSLKTWRTASMWSRLGPVDHGGVVRTLDSSCLEAARPPPSALSARAAIKSRLTASFFA